MYSISTGTSIPSPVDPPIPGRPEGARPSKRESLGPVPSDSSGTVHRSDLGNTPPTSPFLSRPTSGPASRHPDQRGPDSWSRPDSPHPIPRRGAHNNSASVEFVPAERRPLPARFCSHERRRIESIILSSSYAGLRRGVALREPSNKPPITCLNHTRRQTLLTTMPTIGDTPPTYNTLCANTAIVSLTRWACQRSQTHFLGEPTDRDPRAWQDCYSKVGFCVRGAPPTFSCQTPSDPVSGA